MVELIETLDAGAIGVALAHVRDAIVLAGRDPAQVDVLAAVKYVPLEQLGKLAQAGIVLLGENRSQDLAAKAAAFPGVFTWDFIGNLQSRKVREIVPQVRYIHSVCSDSVLAQLGRHGRPETEVMVQVNVAGDPGKAGIAPDQVRDFIARCPVAVVGLMTMPPQAERPEDSRPYFVALRELGAELGLAHLSMGTSQDYTIALQEGATIVRLGTSLYGAGAR